VKRTAACRAFTPLLAEANDSPDDLVRVQALLDLLPSLVLGRFRGSASTATHFVHSGKTDSRFSRPTSGMASTKSLGSGSERGADQMLTAH
jgi:hypothetical protein